MPESVASPCVVVFFLPVGRKPAVSLFRRKLISAALAYFVQLNVERRTVQTYNSFGARSNGNLRIFFGLNQFVLKNFLFQSLNQCGSKIRETVLK